MPNYPPSSPLTLPEHDLGGRTVVHEWSMTVYDNSAADMLTFARLDQHRMGPERGAVGNLAEHTIASLAWRS